MWNFEEGAPSGSRFGKLSEVCVYYGKSEQTLREVHKDVKKYFQIMPSGSVNGSKGVFGPQ
jgi:hypothetical protein